MRKQRGPLKHRVPGYEGEAGARCVAMRRRGSLLAAARGHEVPILRASPAALQLPQTPQHRLRLQVENRSQLSEVRRELRPIPRDRWSRLTEYQAFLRALRLIRGGRLRRVQPLVNL